MCIQNRIKTLLRYIKRLWRELYRLARISVATMHQMYNLTVQPGPDLELTKPFGETWPPKIQILQQYLQVYT